MRLAVFMLGWTLMIIAMMLPGTVLLLARCVEKGPFGARRIAPLILAYLGIWAVFGAVIYEGDSVLHELVEQTPTLAGFIAPGILLLAGVYQLTPMKHVCLARCRPEGAAFNALAQSSHRHRWALGLRHGIFCLGSCWAWMLLMFASGGVNLLWMLTVGTVLAAERSLNRGTLLARVLGLTLILCSLRAMLK
jgi:predicted metal-binding membrane protein